MTKSILKKSMPKKPLKILLAADLNTIEPSNPYVFDLLAGLMKSPEVEHVLFGAGMIGLGDREWDVIHIQWPESLTNWKKVSKARTHEVRAQLAAYRAKGTRVVCTIHNYEPKPSMGESGWDILDAVYCNTTDFIHLGRTSIDDFVARYRHSHWISDATHHVIDHGAYSYDRLPEQELELGEAVSRLPRPIFLVFGAIRTADEEMLARVSFEIAQLDQGTLVFAGKINQTAMTTKERMALEKNSPPNIYRVHRMISDREIDGLFKAVDFVFVPRHGRLNSGVQALSNTYLKPCIVANEGVIGEMAMQSGGVTYEAGDALSAALAIRQAAKMTERETARRQEIAKTYRDQRMTIDSIIRRHLDVYRSSQKIKADGEAPKQRPVFFTIAVNGYDDIWKSCIDTHRAYAEKHGYGYWVVDSIPWAVTPRQAAWMKVEIMRGLLRAGAPAVAFVDADCEIRPHTPDFQTTFSDGHSLILAKGKSGRVNSGVVFIKNTSDMRSFLDLLVRHADTPVPKADATAYENGHFIHYGKDFPGLGFMSHQLWNNNSELDETSYVQHYSGGDLRRHYETVYRGGVSTKESAHALHALEAEKGEKPDLKERSIIDFFEIAATYFQDKFKSLVQ